MKKLLMVSNGELFGMRIFKAASAALIGCALALAFLVASAPLARAQGSDAEKFLQAELGNRSMQSVPKADFLQALCSAVKKHRSAAPQIVRVAVAARPEWKNDILRTAFNCLGTGDCRLLGGVLRGAIAGSPGDASELTALAIELAPGCASSFPGTGGEPGEDYGNFGTAPGNLNPVPGTIAGGGGQGNVVAICHNGETLFVSPGQAEEHLNNHPGDTLGGCVVTGTQNQ